MPGLAERGGPNPWGLELCLEIQRIGDRVLVLTSGGNVGWTFTNRDVRYGHKNVYDCLMDAYSSP